MLLSFYTSRVILQVLGVSDFGVYSIVGSVTATFASLKSVFSEAVLRYLNYEKGRGDPEDVQRVFSLSILIHVAVAVVFCIVVEVVGLWLLNTKLSIPAERFDVAVFVFHVSVISSVIMIFTVPYDAVIISNEKINVYAIVSVADAVLRLCVILLVPYLGFDYLKSYSVLLLLVPVTTLSVYIIYCRRFEECRITTRFDRRLFKEIAAYSSWNFIGNFIFSIVHEALNMLLNVYGGVIENAARNIAYQVRNGVSSFSNNALVAVKPFVIQSSAVNGNDVLFRHTVILSKLAFYLSLIVSVPLILFCEELLHFWLPEVPPNAVIFTQLSIAAILVRSLHGPLGLMYMSLARIKFMTLIEGAVFVLSLGLAWGLLAFHFPLWSIFALLALAELVTVITLAINAKYEFQFTVRPYFRAIGRLAVLSVVVFIQSYFLKLLLPSSGIVAILGYCVLEAMVVLSIIYIFLDEFERNVCKDGFAKLFHKDIARR